MIRINLVVLSEDKALLDNFCFYLDDLIVSVNDSEVNLESFSCNFQNQALVTSYKCLVSACSGQVN